MRTSEVLLSSEDRIKKFSESKQIELFENIEFYSVCDQCKKVYKMYLNKLKADQGGNKEIILWYAYETIQKLEKK